MVPGTFRTLASPHPKALFIALLVVVTALLTTATAQGGQAGGGTDREAECRLDYGDDGSALRLHTYALEGYGVLIDLPTGHDVYGTDGRWYVAGLLDGMPLVPDASVYFLAEPSLTEAFPGSTVTPVQRLFADELLLVTTPGELQDGTAVVVERYALRVLGGVVIMERYEGFDWACFDLVAFSLRSYEYPLGR